MVLQFLYRYWDKADTKLILTALAEGLKSFDSHVEMGKRTFGVLKDLKKDHDIRDDDGRPMWYMPKEMFETQRKLVDLASQQAAIQQHVVDLLTKMEQRIEQHQTDCRNQFNRLDRNTAGDKQ
jgi:hypothetical protein